MTDALLIALALCLVAALLYREWANAAERQKLLDRIQAPDAANMAAIESVIASRPVKPATEAWENIPISVADGDLYIDSILDRVGEP